jgi:hypothetical protein
LPDEAEAAAARVMFIAWLETRGAKNLPTNNQAGATVCTYCGKTARSNSTELGLHVACSTSTGYSSHNPQQQEFCAQLHGTAISLRVGKGKQGLMAEASQVGMGSGSATH